MHIKVLSGKGQRETPSLYGNNTTEKGIFPGSTQKTTRDQTGTQHSKSQKRKSGQKPKLKSPEEYKTAGRQWEHKLIHKVRHSKILAY